MFQFFTLLDLNIVELEAEEYEDAGVLVKLHNQTCDQLLHALNCKGQRFNIFKKSQKIQCLQSIAFLVLMVKHTYSIGCIRFLLSLVKLTLKISSQLVECTLLKHKQ